MESYCSAQAGLICDIKSGLFEMLHLIIFGYLYGDKLIYLFFSLSCFCQKQMMLLNLNIHSYWSIYASGSLSPRVGRVYIGYYIWMLSQIKLFYTIMHLGHVHWNEMHDINVFRINFRDWGNATASVHLSYVYNFHTQAFGKWRNL